jgi:hypothetical protein
MDILRAFSWVFELIPDMEYLSVRDIIEEFAEVCTQTTYSTCSLVYCNVLYCHLYCY